MKDVTLITVNWNQKEAMELMLKSYVAEHYKGAPLHVRVCDNGSVDGSTIYLRKLLSGNEMWGFVSPNPVENIGHENGINMLYKDVKTKYCLLADTDIRFLSSVESYLEFLNEECVAVGEMVGELNAAWGQIKPRLGAWFILFDIEKCREAGINIFRDPSVTDWSYDVGSWFFEQILKAGFTYHNIQRKTDHFDPIAVYEKFIHYGGVSWCLDRPEHSNRIREIRDKHELIHKTLQDEYKYIDLNGKLIL